VTITPNPLTSNLDETFTAAQPISIDLEPALAEMFSRARGPRNAAARDQARMLTSERSWSSAMRRTATLAC
jgi:hypothetical protein